MSCVRPASRQEVLIADALMESLSGPGPGAYELPQSGLNDSEEPQTHHDAVFPLRSHIVLSADAAQVSQAGDRGAEL